MDKDQTIICAPEIIWVKIFENAQTPFWQIHKLGNLGIIANFVFFDVKLDVSGKRGLHFMVTDFLSPVNVERHSQKKEVASIGILVLWRVCSKVLKSQKSTLQTNKTRMHSSRMRTVRSRSHVYPSIHWAGGVYPRVHWGRPTLWTEWQTGVKTLPWRNYVADGNNDHQLMKCFYLCFRLAERCDWSVSSSR